MFTPKLPRRQDRPALLLAVILGLAATGVSLVASGLLVRAFASGHSAHARLVLLTVGTVIGAGALGWLSEPLVTRVRERYPRR